MKKKLLLFYILTIIFIPIKVFGVEIINTEITGTTEKSIGEEILLDYKINFEGIKIDKTTGIWLLQYELIFDEEILSITGITSNGFESFIYKKDDKYYVISEVIENSNDENICSNNILYCGNYQATIKFYIKNTESTETTIKVNNVEVGLLDIIDKEKTYTIEDIIEITNDEEKSHLLKINKTTNNIENKPENIIINTYPNIKEEKNNKELEKEKISSAFIKELKIKNHSIDFEKNKTNYNVTLEKEINELDINVTLEDEKATYKIIGADDIKANNNEIAIIVTSEDNNTITYTINVKYIETIKDNNDNKKIDIKAIITKYMTKDNLTYGAIILGIIIIIILILLLKNKRENKKINKLLGEL